jgi:hypothetical protein
VVRAAAVQARADVAIMQALAKNAAGGEATSGESGLAAEALAAVLALLEVPASDVERPVEPDGAAHFQVCPCPFQVPHTHFTCSCVPCLRSGLCCKGTSDCCVQVPLTLSEGAWDSLGNALQELQALRLRGGDVDVGGAALDALGRLLMRSLSSPTWTTSMRAWVSSTVLLRKPACFSLLVPVRRRRFSRPTIWALLGMCHRCPTGVRSAAAGW